jgi:hypothetical protein
MSSKTVANPSPPPIFRAKCYVWRGPKIASTLSGASKSFQPLQIQPFLQFNWLFCFDGKITLKQFERQKLEFRFDQFNSNKFNFKCYIFELEIIELIVLSSEK